MGVLGKLLGNRGRAERVDETAPGLPNVPLDGSTIRVSPRAWTQAADDGSPEEARAHYLAIVDGAEARRGLMLGTDPLTIGRSPPAQVVLSDPQVSRRHCRLHVEGDKAIVTDLGSTNGTFVDGARVAEPTAIPVGGTLRVGLHLLRHEVRTLRDIEAAQAQWEQAERLRQEAAQVHIEIDDLKRRQEVEKITGSDHE